MKKTTKKAVSVIRTVSQINKDLKAVVPDSILTNETVKTLRAIFDGIAVADGIFVSFRKDVPSVGIPGK